MIKISQQIDKIRPSLKEILIAQAIRTKARAKVLEYLARGIFKQRSYERGSRG